jgi:hypothetical protein
MSTLLIYLAGFFTIPAACAAMVAYGAFIDWRAARRYQRAWDKFTAEWHAMPMGAQTDFLANRPSYEPRYCDGQSAWFAHRWQYGHTKEI